MKHRIVTEELQASKRGKGYLGNISYTFSEGLNNRKLFQNPDLYVIAVYLYFSLKDISHKIKFIHFGVRLWCGSFQKYTAVL